MRRARRLAARERCPAAVAWVLSRPQRCQGAAGIVTCRIRACGETNGIRNILERFSATHHRVGKLRTGPRRNRARRPARFPRRLYQRAPRRAGLYRQGRYAAGARASDVQGGGPDQTDPHGGSGQAHSPHPSGRHRHAGRGDRSRGRRQPFHLRLRLRLSEPVIRRRARAVLCRPPRTVARIARPDLEMLDGKRAVRLERQALARQGHCRDAAAARSAAYADGDGDRHAGHDRARRRPRLYAPDRAARTRSLDPQEGRHLCARRQSRRPRRAAAHI